MTYYYHPLYTHIDRNLDLTNKEFLEVDDYRRRTGVYHIRYHVLDCVDPIRSRFRLLRSLWGGQPLKLGLQNWSKCMVENVQDSRNTCSFNVQRVAFPLPNLSTGWAHFSQQRKWCSGTWHTRSTSQTWIGGWIEGFAMGNHHIYPLVN